MMPQIGSASNYFASICVPDAGRAVAAALDVPAGLYNVCDDEPVSFAEYLHTLTKAIGAPKPFRLPALVGRWMFGDVWKYFPRSQKASNARLKSVSNWRPAVKSVTEGWPIIAAELGLGQGRVQPKASHVQDSVLVDKGVRRILSERQNEGGLTLAMLNLRLTDLKVRKRRSGKRKTSFRGESAVSPSGATSE